jgi:hypothetical protein
MVSFFSPDFFLLWGAPGLTLLWFLFFPSVVFAVHPTAGSSLTAAIYN